MKILQSNGIIILAIILISSVQIYGQKNLNQSTTVDKKNTVVFSPLNLFNRFNPTLQIGYERMLNEKFALEIEGGYMLKAWVIELFNAEKRYNKGYKVELELKYSYIKKKQFIFYSSCEFSYLINKSDSWDEFMVSDTSYNYSFELPEDLNYFTYTDSFTNKKTKYGLNLKTGVKFFIGPYLIETYAGLGVVQVTNQHSNRENIKDRSTSHTSLLNSTRIGKNWFVNLPVNVKIGYRF